MMTVSSTFCSTAAIPPPVVFGAEVLSMAASWVNNYTMEVPADFNYNHGDVSLHNARFCNITVTYTHPGHGDRITVETWLPERWNRRLQATGGGGWSAGRFVLSQFFMSGAIGEGYAATTTDAGLGDAPPASWALTSPGNVNLYNLQNLGYVSLNDQAIIGKSLAKSFYGRDAEYSYWSGCSQGGRQGLMLAQRYPTAYDGIAASAPALSWTQLASSTYYPLLLQDWLGASSPPLACELNFITDQVVAHCDPLDGIVDGVISNMEACDFDALSVVNKTFHCTATNKKMPLSEKAAVVANAAWSGPRTADGDFLWYGYNKGANISSFGTFPGTNSTNQDIWFSSFLVKNKSYNVQHATHREFDRLFRRAVQEYSDLMNADNPDLTEFKEAGGKLISYHGMADQSIPTKSSENYYRAVSKHIPTVRDFYRYFEAPGLGHCSGGAGGQPLTTFNALRSWVEDGIAPESLPVTFKDVEGVEHARVLCPYPAKAVYRGGNVSDAASFQCLDDATKA